MKSYQEYLVSLEYACRAMILAAKTIDIDGMMRCQTSIVGLLKFIDELGLPPVDAGAVLAMLKESQ